MPSDTEGSVRIKQMVQAQRPACCIYRLVQSYTLRARMFVRILRGSPDVGSSRRSSAKSRAFVVIAARG